MTKPTKLQPPKRSSKVTRKRYQPAAMRLYDKQSRRLYINANERVLFARAAKKLPPEAMCFCAVLLFTGCRISEAIALTANDIQIEDRVISFRTLKQRGKVHIREVPVPKSLIDKLSKTFDLANGELDSGRHLWMRRGKVINRARAYRWVKQAMQVAGIIGQMATPKGLRHGFGIHAMRCGVQLNMLQKWMGHASIQTTTIYADAIGPEERMIAARMWTENNPLDDTNGLHEVDDPSEN